MAGLTIIDSFEHDERRDRNECCSFSTQERGGGGVEENLLSSGVDFPLSNTCQFFSLSRGEEDGKIIAAKKRMKGERVGGKEEGRRRGGY